MNIERMNNVDLSRYRLQATPKSRCGNCHATVFLLCPRFPFEDEPMFYLCAKCGRISQAGVGEIAPPEVEDDTIPLDQDWSKVDKLLSEHVEETPDEALYRAHRENAAKVKDEDNG